jgi:hypothetical protein
MPRFINKKPIPQKRKWWKIILIIFFIILILVGISILIWYFGFRKKSTPPSTPTPPSDTPLLPPPASIISNIPLYGSPYVPPYAYSCSPIRIPSYTPIEPLIDWSSPEIHLNTSNMNGLKTPSNSNSYDNPKLCYGENSLNASDCTNKESFVIDLRKNYNIKKIRVVNGVDCCKEKFTPFSLSVFNGVSVVYNKFISDIANNNNYYDFIIEKIGQTIMIQSSSVECLHLADVQVSVIDNTKSSTTNTTNAMVQTKK